MGNNLNAMVRKDKENYQELYKPSYYMNNEKITAVKKICFFQLKIMQGPEHVSGAKQLNKNIQSINTSKSFYLH